METFLNQAEVARRWRLSPRTLERWRWQNRGPHFMKVGKAVRYRIEDVEAYERGQLRTIDGKRPITSNCARQTSFDPSQHPH